MKKVFLVTLMAVAAIFGSCSKDPKLTPSATEKTENNENTVNDRSGATVTISNVYGFKLCGNIMGSGCPACGNDYGTFTFDESSGTVNMITKNFCLTNTSGSTKVVSFLISGCTSATSISVPAGITCFRIVGCSVVTGCI